ncbi:unannotated protein [freshwater metagenome]|uniref:Unannotated protein n=1 Tax=freshwater metagenome TaxID=449393 RepID=A0A6J6EBA7_9ZZZZ
MAEKEVPFSPSITNRFVRTDDSSLITADRSCDDWRTTERVPSAANRSIAAGVTDGSSTCVRLSGAAAKAADRTLSPAAYSVSMTDPRPPAMREPESIETKGRLKVCRIWFSGRTEESPASVSAWTTKGVAASVSGVAKEPPKMRNCSPARASCVSESRGEPSGLTSSGASITTVAAREIGVVGVVSEGKRNRCVTMLASREPFGAVASMSTG